MEQINVEVFDAKLYPKNAKLLLLISCTFCRIKYKVVRFASLALRDIVQ